MDQLGNARMPSLRDKLYGQPEPIKAAKPKKAKVELPTKKTKK